MRQDAPKTTTMGRGGNNPKRSHGLKKETVGKFVGGSKKRQGVNQQKCIAESGGEPGRGKQRTCPQPKERKKTGRKNKGNNVRTIPCDQGEIRRWAVVGLGKKARPQHRMVKKDR